MDSGKPSADRARAWRLALEHYQAGRMDEAERMCELVIDADPGEAEALHLLGAIAHRRGNHARAVDLTEEAARIDPSRADYLNTLGVANQAMGNIAEAEDSFRGALSLKPDYAAAHNNLGIALRDLKRPQEAEQSFHEAVRIQPGYAEAHNNRGNALSELGLLEKAERSLRKAIRIRPDYAEAHGNLGIVLRGMRKLVEAERSTRRALALKPDYAEAFNDLGVVLFGLGRLPEAEDGYRQALSLNPGLAVAQGNLAFLLNCVSGRSAAEIHAAHREFALRFCPPAESPPHANARDPERRLRVGYVSADLRRHSVAFFIEPVLAGHDRANFEIFCYSNSAHADDVTERLKSCADQWRDVSALDDEALANLVREDAIDILVDLGGFSANNRLTVFARKPSPVQATWLGYPTTTGMQQMDCRISDWVVDPEGAEGLSAERVVRLPGSYFCYGGPGLEPEVGTQPVLRDGRVTFGSFNNLSKIDPETMRLWVRVLDALPDSRLVLKSGPLAEKLTAEDVRRRFEALGLARERLILSGWKAGLNEHLQAYRDVDIALDSYPYNGATTTCEALWMGVPVVSLAGETHASRMGASILGAVGLQELVAQTPDQYLDIATGLARDPARLAALRAGLRARMRASALMDAQGFTRDLESAYREMWRSWCAEESKRSFFGRILAGFRNRRSAA
jgi:predicted O-linked N-acetylglucosamine transferase (SPINDLY family)